ncbi:MAG TPA: diacylglycerol kinase family protein [Clostridia bacterium]|nr:diacylglycerol kinase family protein [Clostridia bacterium]
MKKQGYPRYVRKRVKLIFNPASGANRESPLQLMNVIKELQARHFVAEPYLTEPDSDLESVVRDAVVHGFRTFVVCGGDGTVSAVARAMKDLKATLGIIPTGTQNNVALGLGIPADIPAAIDILRTGRRHKIDMGIASCSGKSMPFLEICSVGLFSALFEAGDDIQHGNLARVGEFLATLTASPPSEIRILLDENEEIINTGHVLLVSNMPYVGRHFHVGTPDCFRDGLFDVLFCSDISKLDLLIGYMLKVPGMNVENDSRIRNYHVSRINIEAHPAMAVMADGIQLGEGPVQIEMQHQALSVILPAATGINANTGESHAK